jgi:hypothetical protein
MEAKIAVFICCADESSDAHQQNQFFFGGFAAPVSGWDEEVIPAWNERVLAGPPAIPYLHCTDAVARRSEWRNKYGLTQWDAASRMTEGAYVLGSAGCLIPIVWSLPYEQFRRDVLPYAPTKAHTGLEGPDYLAFLCFAFSTLQWLSLHGPKTEKVHFWVERNGKITTRVGRFHERMPENLREIGRSDLADLCGEFVPVSKECIQAQAADMLCWHERSYYAGTLDRVGIRRRAHIIGSKTLFGCGREGCRNDVADALFDDFTQSLARNFPKLRTE